MRNLLNSYRPLFAPEGGGDGGGGDPGAGGDNAGDNGGGGGGGGGDAGGGNKGGKQTKQGSNGGDNGGGGDPPALHVPKGLPNTMVGKTNEETLDNVTRHYNELRTENGKRKASDKLDDYALKDVPDALQPRFGDLEGNAVWDTIRTHFQKADVGPEAFNSIMQGIVGDLAEAGVLGDVIDEQAERAKLLPESAKMLTPAEQANAIQARVQGNIDAVEKTLVEKHGLPKELGEFMLQQLGDRGDGQLALEWIHEKVTGERPAPFLGSGNGAGGDNFDYGGSNWDPSHPDYDAAAAQAHLDKLNKQVGPPSRQ